MVETTKSAILLRILLTCVFNTWYMLCLLGLLLCHHYIIMKFIFSQHVRIYLFFYSSVTISKLWKFYVYTDVFKKKKKKTVEHIV